VECFRRLLLASIIGIASGDSALAPVIGFLLCLAFIHLFSKRPYKKDEDSTLGIVLTYSLAHIFLGALLIKVNAQPNGKLERSVFENVLIFLLLMGPGLIVMNTLRSILTKCVNRCKKRCTSERITDDIKKNEVRRPRRKQVSLVRPRTKSRLPDSGVIECARNDWVTNPIAAEIEGEPASRELQEQRPTLSVAEDGIELKEIKEELSKDTAIKRGFELIGIKEELTAF
jgi:hypothetical protein